MSVRTKDDAATWTTSYALWESTWSDYMKQRTYATATTSRPAGISRNATWWYTHRQLRKARALYRTVIRDHALFTWLDQPQPENPTHAPNPRTTSPLEGGPNAAIKRFLRAHRGLTGTHMQTGVDWVLNSLTEQPASPHTAAHAYHQQQQHKQAEKQQTNNIQPKQYDTAIDQYEHYETVGLSIRKGWAGHTH